MTGEAILGRNLYALDALEERVSQVIYQLPLRGPDGSYLIGDEEVRTTAISAQTASKALWRLGCSARAEIVRRIKERTSDQAVLRREVVREAVEQGVAVRTLRDDARIGETFAPLFAGPDTAPDLSKEYYRIALHSPDPPAALALAQQRKDQNPLYSTSDFEADLARMRLGNPHAAYGPQSAGRVALVYAWPYWDEGVLEATEKMLALPLQRWMLPDSTILLRVPPRALDLACRIMNAFEVRYQTTFFVPVSPYRDACVWHEKEMLVCGTVGKLRLPDGLPGTWRDQVARSIDLYFPFCRPRLAVYPRQGMAVGDDWTMIEDLPEYIR